MAQKPGPNDKPSLPPDTSEARPEIDCPLTRARRNSEGAAIEASGFYLQPIANPVEEAEAFLRQMATETGNDDRLEARLVQMREEFALNGVWRHTLEELTFGARIAWRNSVRCIGRMFWPSLTAFDAREAKTTADIFEAVLSQIEWGSNGGDLRPAITVFRPGPPEIRILNPQLILYAGYRQPDGTVLGDPKNVALTDQARQLGWRGAGSRFDVLPLLIRIGDGAPDLFEIPPDRVIEVSIAHPECAAVETLGLKWFALPAVSGMALDLGGVQYTAAPTNGIYQVTEIGSFNLADPRRYDQLPEVADALGLDRSWDNPLWRDQAIVELNRAVLHSFNHRGVRIMDHHALSSSFERFCRREAAEEREVYGHWPWIVPPLSANLSWIWHEKGFRKTILKPNYFYQRPS
jgi:nitric-oxide synthase